MLKKAAHVPSMGCTSDDVPEPVIMAILGPSELAKQHTRQRYRNAQSYPQIQIKDLVIVGIMLRNPRFRLTLVNRPNPDRVLDGSGPKCTPDNPQPTVAQAQHPRLKNGKHLDRSQGEMKASVVGLKTAGPYAFF
ncbi:hypothetical protein M422DRAFT_241055 [Sphaerobolus stellatus SS14]|nr:hypothetical protein M422DRAFT_241055 [Sphaerobolus stellatus SS14]